MNRHRSRLRLTVLLVLALTALGAIFLFFVGVDALEDRSSFQFFADSGTYHKAARGDLLGFESDIDSVTVYGNYLGPLLILRLAGQNYYVVLLINALLLLASISSIAKSLKLDSLRFAALLLINPLTFSSLLSVNKEIMSLVFVALLLKFLATRALWALVAAALISILVRWQLSVFLMTLLMLESPLNPLRHKRVATLSAFLVALSILYGQLAAVLEPIRYAFEQSAAEYEGSGLYEWLQGWQEAGAYWLIFPLKAAHLLFGLGLRFDRLVSPVDIYNDVWQLLHSTMTLVLFFALWRAGRFRLKNDLVYIAVIYVAVFGMSPIYSPRYFYPVYVLWAAALAVRSSNFESLLAPVTKLKQRLRHRRVVAATQPSDRPEE